MKVKKGPLSRVEEFYIQNNPDNLSPQELAEALNRSVKQVEDAQSKPKNIVTTPAAKTPMRNLMGTHRRKGKSVASVMTPAASELSDKIRQTKKPSLPSTIVHRPFEE